MLEMKAARPYNRVGRPCPHRAIKRDGGRAAGVVGRIVGTASCRTLGERQACCASPSAMQAGAVLADDASFAFAHRRAAGASRRRAVDQPIFMFGLLLGRREYSRDPCRPRCRPRSIQRRAVIIWRLAKALDPLGEPCAMVAQRELLDRGPGLEQRLICGNASSRRGWNQDVLQAQQLGIDAPSRR